MNKKKKILSSQFISSLFTFLIPFIMGIAFYNKLPDKMAIHFDNNNVANGFAPKWFALFGTIFILLVLHFFVVFTIENDPKKQGQSKSIKVITYWLTPVIAIFMQFSFISYSLNMRFNITTYVLIATGILITILGNYLPKTKQNYTIGIRCPWTLSSEENWNKTHRLSGILWVICGIIIIILSIFSKYNYIIFIMLIMALVPLIYSYLLYRKQQENN